MKHLKTITFPLLAFIMIYVLSSCNCIVGEGNIELEEREVSGFNKISLGIHAKVILKQDSAYSMRVNAQANILELLKTEVQGNTLKIDYGFNCVRDAREVTIYLSMPELQGVDVSGSGKVICMQGFRTKNLDLDVSGSGEIMMEAAAAFIQSRISGSGKIDIAGKAKKHELDISGSGGIYAFNLRTTDTKVHINGSGDAKVYAIGSLYARISGSGSVYYKGEPELSSDMNGSGQVIKKN